MKRSGMLFCCIMLLVATLPANAQENDDYAELSAVGYYTSTSDWEGDPLSLEWDGGFHFGADTLLYWRGLLFTGRWTYGEADLTGDGIEDVWSVNNVELLAGWRFGSTPLYLLGGYKHWQLDLEEIHGVAVEPLLGPRVDTRLSFDGLGGGLGVYWQDRSSALFFSGQALYYVEVDSSLEDVGLDTGFDRALTFNGEIGMEFQGGIIAAIGARFEQVHQDLPEEDRVAPFIDFGHEQFSITLRVGVRFGN